MIFSTLTFSYLKITTVIEGQKETILKCRENTQLYSPSYLLCVYGGGEGFLKLNGGGAKDF